jgi:hypothetical protein
MDMVASAEPSQMLIDHRALERRAQRYSSRCAQWRDRRASQERPLPGERDHPAAIVGRLSDLVCAEIARALAESRDTGPEQQLAHADSYGSAAIALIAIEQSRLAWLALVHEQDVLATAAQPFVSDLVWLKHEVERTFPGVRFATTRSGGGA